MLTKQELRTTIINILKKQKEEDRCRKSGHIRKKLFRTSVFRKAKIVMFYIAFGGEVETKEMIKAAQRLGKKVAVPVCMANGLMKPCLLPENAHLHRGLYGVYEPEEHMFIENRDLDLVLVPGIAFDKTGNRLGRGKGYYDRFLQRLPRHAPSLGLAFDFQILPAIPATQDDVQVNSVIFA
jgi:5-formyltetrahydrofolate cyclo-ligase